MSIRIYCPHCKGVMEARDELLGTQALCPFCRKVIKVEKAPEAAPPPKPAEPPPPAAPARAEKPAAPAKKEEKPVPTAKKEEPPVALPKSLPPEPRTNDHPPVPVNDHVMPTAAYAEPAPPRHDAPAKRQKPARAPASNDSLASTQERIGLVLSHASGHREKRNRFVIMLQSLVRRGNPTDASLALSGLVAGVLAVLFFLPVYYLLPHGNQVRELLVGRGWVQYATVYFTTWAAVVLAIKYWKIATQQVSLSYDVLPVDRTRITPGNVHLVEEHIRKLPVNARQSFMINRILMALEHFKARKNVQEVGAVLNNQAETDAGIVDSSYSMLKVLIWCIPILGFIGTVVGISVAVNNFDKGIQAKDANIEVVKRALGEVTNGLAVAFDTTYLGLILSMVIMFPTNSVQKAEEDLLSTIDQYCNEKLLPRLSTEEETEEPPPDPVEREDFARLMAMQQQALQEWQKRLEYMETVLLEKVVSTLGDVKKELGRNNGPVKEDVVSS